MRRVLIGTPSYSGSLDVWYVNSLLQTKELVKQWGIQLDHVFMSYDALIQRSRNDIISLAINGGYDDLIFIDSDMEWNPEWIFSLLSREEQVVGGTARKKTDTQEMYVGKTTDLTIHENGLIKCEGLGTGFVKIGRQALLDVWNASIEYTNENKTCRMVCEIGVVNGQLYSEDTILFLKLQQLGYQAWLDPTMTCNHTGSKKYQGDFLQWIHKMNS